MQEKWQLNRAGLINFWYYDDTFYQFSDGKLLLRGANGSGKSVTTASLLPLMLDGRTNPARLDPFGSASRKIEDYLLGEKDVSKVDERTGYLVMEYKKGNSERYLTTGVGLQARRNKELKKWYFVIHDNHRIGIDFQIWHDLGDGQRRPYSKRELVNRMGESGEVYSKRGDYAEMINKYLFGFENMDGFEELIQLQVELRKPKLSRDFSPTVIYGILEQSLPPLKDEDLHSVSDALESIELAKAQLAKAEQDYALLTDLQRRYERYHQAVLAKLGDRATDIGETYKGRQKKERDVRQTLTELNRQKTDLENEKFELHNRLGILKDELEQLKQHDVFQLGKEKHDAEDRLRDIHKALKNLDEKIQKNKNSYHRILGELRGIEQEERTTIEELEELVAELDDHVSLTGFQEKHAMMLADYGRLGEKMTFSYWQKEAQVYQKGLNNAQLLLMQQRAIERELTELDRENGAKMQEKDELVLQAKHWEFIFSDELNRIEFQLEEWRKDSPFPITSENWQAVFSRLYRLYGELPSYHQAIQPLRNDYEAFRGGQQKRQLESTFAIEQCRNRAKELSESLAEWKNKKIPVPERGKMAVAERDKLQEQGLSVAAFYELLEFKEGIADDVKDRIEGALLETGLLDALVSEAKLDLSENRQIIPHPMLMNQTLETYLEPAKDLQGIPKGLVEDILQSVLIDEDEEHPVAVTTVGRYKIGIVSGKTTEEHEAKYIGKDSQLRFIAKRIAEIETELENKRKDIELHQQQKDAIRALLDQAEKQMQALPTDDNLAEADNQLKDNARNLKNILETLEQLQTRINRKKEEYSEKKFKLDDCVEELHIRLDETWLEEAQTAIQNYQGALSDLRQKIDLLPQLAKRKEDKEAHLRQVEETLTEDQDSLAEKTGEEKSLRDKIRSIDERLVLEGADEVNRRIADVLQELEQKDARYNSLVEQDLLQNNTSLNTRQQELLKITVEVRFYGNLFRAWENLFQREYDRYADSTEENQNRENIMAEYQARFKSNGPDYEDSKKTELHKFVRERMLDLSEYSPEIDESERVGMAEWMNEEWPDSLQANLEMWRAYSTRSILTVIDDQNKRTSIFRQVVELSAYIAEQKQYVNQEDHRLFEDILLHSIGTILRSLINRAEKWAKQMNQILQRQQNSSGLQLSIQWEPKKAETDDEMHTSELVELLRRPAQSLTDEDVERMVRHFRSKIELAKIEQEKDDSMQTLNDVMKYILDYRRWFQFKLKYQKPNDIVRELTNQRFFQFSGGEKAISMYLPLFTAVYSRYQDAGPEAPYIIALDEAFAGVDELNIGELFKAMEELQFNYILNSQALWGDYPSVGALNIYQLIRPRNAPYVSYMAYHWNGEQHEVIGDENDDGQISG